MQGSTKCAIKGAHFVPGDKLCRGDKMCGNKSFKEHAAAVDYVDRYNVNVIYQAINKLKGTIWVQINM